MNIHSLACIHPKAKISKGVSIGAYSIVDDSVFIDEGVQIGSFCRVHKGVTIHKNVKLFDGCIIGSTPQDLKYQNEPSFVVIGENTQVREYATINGSTRESSATMIGKDCLLMSYIHIAHDCQLGDRIILANSTHLCGHVEIHSDTVISGMCAFHQWTSVGKGCYVAGMIKIDRDILPFSKILGPPMTWAGLNTIGLRKQSFKNKNFESQKCKDQILKEQELLLKKVYRKSNSESSLIQELKKEPTNFLFQEVSEFLSQRKSRPLLPTWLNLKN